MVSPPAKAPAAAYVHADMLELKGEQRLLTQRLESSITAMASSLTALQADMQGVKARIEHLATAQNDFTHHSGAVDRLAKTIEKLIADNERRWETHERDNGAVSKQVNTHATGIKVAWLGFGLIAAVLVALANSQVNQVNARIDAGLARQNERIDDHLSTGNETRRAFENRFLRNENDIRQLQDQRGVIRSP